jgi:OFA family oxalate/formate antiporter-like MFS transporter
MENHTAVMTQDASATAVAPIAGERTNVTTRWFVLIGAVTVQLILGTVYGYSIFWTPLMPKIFGPVLTQAEAAGLTTAGQPLPPGAVVIEDEAAAAAERTRQEGLLKYAFSICYVSFASVMLFAGRVQDIKGPRFTATIGGVLIGAGFLAAGELLRNPPVVGSSTNRLLILWATVGLLAGAGIGFAYVCPIAALIKWFPRQKGLVSGLAVAGFGFGAYLFKGESVIGALGYIRRFGIERFFLTHGLVCLAVISLGALLLRNPPGTPRTAPTESTWQLTLRRPAFYVLWLMFFSGTLVGLMVIGIAANFAGEQMVRAHASGGAILDKETIATLMGKGAAAVGWLAIFNALGRIAWGFVSDRIGRTGAFVTNFTAQAIVMILLARISTELGLAAAICTVGFNYGGALSMFPSATADLFGAKNLGANYAWVFTCNAFSGVAGVAIGNLSKARTGSYKAAFTIAAGMCLLSAALAIGLRVSQKRAGVRA